jgi:hypothetical protein
MTSPYRGYDVLEKWNSPSFDAQTRRIVAKRLHEIPPRRFFAPEQLAILQAIVERIAPDFPGPPLPIALWLDERLFLNQGEGFRREGDLPMQESWRIGVAAIDAEACRRFSRGMTALDAASRDQVLGAVQRGEVDAGLWPGVSAKTFFSDMLLKTVAGLAYSHPSAWNDIGFGGPASPRGYVRLGFNERDAWEAEKKR